MVKKQHRQYQNDYPSVTEILGVLRKIGLEQWFLSNTRAYCNEKSRKGKEIGTQIHEAIQSYIETGEAKVDTEYDVEVTNALKSFMLFRKENPEIKLQRSEICLTSELYEYNGTLDCVGEDFVADWKTCEVKDQEHPKIWDEWKYQVASYVHLLNECEKKNITRAVIIALAKDKVSYSKYWMDANEIEDCFNKVFLPCLSIINYQKRSK